MDEFLAHTTAALESLISALLGPGAQQAVAGRVTWGDLAAVLCYALLAAILNALTALYIRHRTGRIGHTFDHGEWMARVFGALGKPLYILIWVYGLYVIATPVRLKLPPGTALLALREALNAAFDFGAFVVFFWFLFRLTRVLEARLSAWAARTPSKVDDLLVPLLGATLRMLVIVFATILALPMLHLPAEYASAFEKLTGILLIVSFAVLLCRAVSICKRVILANFDIAATDNLQARKVYTQLQMIGRVVYVVIGLITAAAVLMLFDQVRHVGTSLLASAGIVGVVAGFAAQKTLTNLFAGFQIAFTQPIRQDDVLVVEGEWGRVEEISLSYVVVRLWDDRRLILPLSYFIEKPFQNWTRTSASVTGSVFVWVDYSFPVEAARRALRPIIETSPLWDRRFWNLQVSDANDRGMQLRVLATSADSSRSWDLRCEIREKLIAWIQRHHPESLPRVRFEPTTSAPPVAAASPRS
jgi:small-conductance mechanosensitive channel